MFGHSLKKRGVAMVEYAVLLAFVTAIGGLFMDDSKLSAAVAGSIDRVTKIINGTFGDQQSQDKLHFKGDANDYAEGLNMLFKAVLDATPEGITPFNYKIVNNNDGTASVEYVYKKGGKYDTPAKVPNVDISFFDNDKFPYTITGENFISVNEQGEFVTSAYGRPTRIGIVNKNNANDKKYLRLDPDEQSFFINPAVGNDHGYFGGLY